MSFTVAIVFTAQAWLLNGQAAIVRDPATRTWGVQAEAGDRVYNAHHLALQRLTRETARVRKIRRR